MTFNLKEKTIAAQQKGNASISLLESRLADVGIEMFSAQNIWRLKMLDPPETEYVGMYVLDKLTENVGQRLKKTDGLNQQEPAQAYLGGSASSFTFQTKLWASDTTKNLKRSVDKLKMMCKRDPKLKRAPIFKFTSGTEIACKCFVETVGGIVYDTPRKDGTIRSVSLDITLSVIEDLPTKEQGVSLKTLLKEGLSVVTELGKTLGSIDIPGGSLHRRGRLLVTKEGQTFESIAAKEYGNALLGDILRRIYYQRPLSQVKMSIEVGDVIDLVDATDISKIEVTPQSIFLADNTTNRDAIKKHFELRGKTKTIFV